MGNHRLSDLNATLFAQLDRLAATEISGVQLEAEIKRADAIVAVSDQIISSAVLQLRAATLFAQHGASVLPHLPLIGKAVGE